MGLNLIGFSSDKTDKNYEEYKISNVDPNPRIYKIIKYKEIGKGIVVLVNYPNCTNFEGNKIIVYENTTIDELNKLDQIDPHFTNRNGTKPFARFVPNDKGWTKAISLLKIMELW